MKYKQLVIGGHMTAPCVNNSRNGNSNMILNKVFLLQQAEVRFWKRIK